MNYSNLVITLENIKSIFDLYRTYGNRDYIGESVSQLEHAFQCAYNASLDYPDNKNVILGAFLHDVGHLLAIEYEERQLDVNLPANFKNISMDECGLKDHENIGADFLKGIGFLDLLTITFVSRFGKKPMHFFGVLGSLMFMLGFCLFAYIGGVKLYFMLNSLHAQNIAEMSWFYIALTSMIIGVQLFLVGFIAEMVSRNTYDRNNYHVEKES